ncbi:MAG: hypothetical protein JWO38_7637 [Gemmataceae bacterium]|nr:hypothetical protein [Gemmataceae bacterium]
MSRPDRVRLALESLETRENPTGGPTETFDSTTTPALPNGWAEWSNDGSTVFATAAGQGVGGSIGVVSSGASPTAGLAWESQVVSGDTGAAAAVKLNSLVPTFVFARGTNLGTSTPSYLAAVITRGVSLSVVEVTNGAAKVLAGVASPRSTYFSGGWVQVSIVPTGSSVAVQVVRQDTGQYLNAQGTWQSAATNAITVNTSLPDAAGHIGIGRGAMYADPTTLDNFQQLPPASPPPVGVSQSFDTTPPGQLPAGWSGWTGDPPGGFAVSSARALSGADGLASTGGSAASARAWYSTELPADVTASAAVFLDTLIPAQLIVRGSNLNTASPTYYALTISRGVQANLVRVVNGVTTTLGSLSSSDYFSWQWAQVRLTAVGNELLGSVYRSDTKQWLTSAGAWSSSQANVFDVRDAAITGAGLVGVGRVARYAGTVTFDDFSAGPAGATTSPPPATVSIPQHNPSIRIAELAYSGTPFGATETQLLKNNVDLVVSNPQYMQTINATAPNTPQLVYSNVSNLYEGLLLSWLNYAAANGIDPETAFYHVTQPTAYSGTSASSKPVNWFWGAFQSAAAGAPTDLTSAAHNTTGTGFGLGGAGQWTAVGYPDRFAEVDVNLKQAAAAGWSGSWQYATAVDANGNPTGWKTLTIKQDGTNGLTRSGTVTFDPPPDWVTAAVQPGGIRLYYVRFLTTAGAAAQAPVLQSLLGADYTTSNGSTGVIPVFDAAADKDHDGYLNDAEWAARTPGDNARFAYQSRLFYPNYGPMRFITNPSAAGFQAWAAGFSVQLLAQNPLAAGIFLDNESGKLPFQGVAVAEPTATYSTDSGALVAAVSRAVGPGKLVMVNTSGGGSQAGAVAAAAGAVFEEFLLRPLASTWSQVGDVYGIVAQRLAAAGNPYVVIDSLPNGGSPTDPRTQIATLAYYYLLGDPARTMLMFYGGSSPNTSWSQHWTAAAGVNIGQPGGAMQVLATGADPENPALTYKVFGRSYSNGLVLYKPLSYTLQVGQGRLDDATATAVPLGGNYRAVNADGTLGPVVSSVSLRNGEGAVLVKA